MRGGAERRGGADMEIKLAATYLGTVVGAGFASGQEHLHFFVGFSSKGNLGVLLAGLLFIVFGVLLADLASRHGTSSPEELLALVAGRALVRTLDWLLTVFMFCSLGIMLSGSGALFREQAGLAAELGMAITAAVTLIASTRGVAGLLSINALLAPLLLGVPVTVAAISLIRAGCGVLPPPYVRAAERVSGNLLLPAWPVSSVVYVSYNLLLAFAAFASMGEELEDTRTARRGAALGGAVLLIFLAAIHVTLMLHGEEVWRTEVPMLLAASRLGAAFRLAYSAVLWVAMITTAAAGGFAMSRRLAKRVRVSQQTLAAVVTLAAALVAQIGFARLVGRVYPVFGYLGLPLVLGLAAAYVRERLTITILT